MTHWKCSNCGIWSSGNCNGMTIYKGDLLCWDCTEQKRKDNNKDNNKKEDQK